MSDYTGDLDPDAPWPYGWATANTPLTFTLTPFSRWLYARLRSSHPFYPKRRTRMAGK